MFTSNKKEGFKKLELKAQFTVVALIMIFIMLLIFVKLYPTMKTYIDEVTPELDEMSALIVSLIPFMVAVAIFMSITWYIIPRRQ